MDLSDWKFHGLILRPEGEHLYHAARAAEEGSDAKSRKRRTLDLFAWLFQKILLVDLPVIWVGGADSEGEEGGGCYDGGLMVVVHANGDSPALKVLCFVDAHDSGDEGGDDALVEGLEKRALEGCKGYLGTHPEEDKIHACTLIGAKIRCWRLDRPTEGDEEQHQLLGLWAEQCRGRSSHYLDIGLDHNQNRTAIEGALSQMLGGLAIRLSPWYC
jgi:hypothetical protein